MVGFVRGDLWRLLSSFWRRLVHITDAILDSILKCVVSGSRSCLWDRYEQLRRSEKRNGKWPVERHLRDHVAEGSFAVTCMSKIRHLLRWRNTNLFKISESKRFPIAASLPSQK